MKEAQIHVMELILKFIFCFLIVVLILMSYNTKERIEKQKKEEKTLYNYY